MWQKAVERNRWSNFSELRGTFASADRVGSCVVFDVGHNRYRAIARVDYRLKRVFVLALLTHAEYDKGTWFKSCRCDEPGSRFFSSPKAAPKSPPKKKDES